MIDTDDVLADAIFGIKRRGKACFGVAAAAEGPLEAFAQMQQQPRQASKKAVAVAGFVLLANRKAGAFAQFRDIRRILFGIIATEKLQ